MHDCISIDLKHAVVLYFEHTVCERTSTMISFHLFWQQTLFYMRLRCTKAHFMYLHFAWQTENSRLIYFLSETPHHLNCWSDFSCCLQPRQIKSHITSEFIFYVQRRASVEQQEMKTWINECLLCSEKNSSESFQLDECDVHSLRAFSSSLPLMKLNSGHFRND